MLALAALAVLGSCRGRDALAVHYLAQFVPGSRALFAPAAVALAPPKGAALTRQEIRVGAIYGATGAVDRPLYVRGFGPLLRDALAAGLADAGLRPMALGRAPADHRPPAGAEFLLTCALRELVVDKRFGTEDTVHGRYFTMHAVARLEFAIFDRGGTRLYSSVIAGSEDEPPAPVGGEVFLPLETDPGESLSVALSRAVGLFLVDPGTRRVLPPRGSAVGQGVTGRP